MRSLVSNIVAVKPGAIKGRMVDCPVDHTYIHTSPLVWTWNANAPLHEFMKDLYLKRGGGDRNFNQPCNLVLESGDLPALRKQVTTITDADVDSLMDGFREGAVLVYLPKY